MQNISYKDFVFVAKDLLQSFGIIILGEIYYKVCPNMLPYHVHVGDELCAKYHVSSPHNKIK